MGYPMKIMGSPMILILQCTPMMMISFHTRVDIQLLDKPIYKLLDKPLYKQL